MKNIPADVWRIEVTYQYDGAGFSAEFSEITEKRVMVSLTRVWGYVSNTDDNWVWVMEAGCDNVRGRRH